MIPQSFVINNQFIWHAHPPFRAATARARAAVYHRKPPGGTHRRLGGSFRLGLDSSRLPPAANLLLFSPAEKPASGPFELEPWR